MLLKSAIIYVYIYKTTANKIKNIAKKTLNNNELLLFNINNADDQRFFTIIQRLNNVDKFLKNFISFKL